MKVVFINPYELGRQSLAIAAPVAVLKAQGFVVDSIDLALQRLTADKLQDAGVVAIHLGMHTATRIAAAALPRIREFAPQARICVYGWYAAANARLFYSLGAVAAFSGEIEEALRVFVCKVRDGQADLEQAYRKPLVITDAIPWQIPERSGMPALDRYAKLVLADNSQHTVGFVETTRGCKHRCRHCPVVPVYQGRFRAIPKAIVLADIRQQVAAGAQHISFGDPDFLNGPGHTIRILEAMHTEFPELSFDATIKVSHLLAQQALLPRLRDWGCLFITCAVESTDDVVLDKLQKGHHSQDFATVVRLTRACDIALSPTFVPFTPWSSLSGYCALLASIAQLQLVPAVPSIQLAIRLLVPAGSQLLDETDVLDYCDDFDPQLLGYPWRHPQPAVDILQRRIQELVEEAEVNGLDRQQVFAQIWRLAQQAVGQDIPLPEHGESMAVPHLSESWYCCAEPTSQQLQQF